MAFDGLSVYKTGLADTMARSIAPTIRMISPTETQFLDSLNPPESPVPAKQHWWMWEDEELNPITLSCSCAIASETGVSSMYLTTEIAESFPVHTMLVNPTSGERVIVVSGSGYNLNVTRAQGSTTATSYGVTSTWDLVSLAALDGKDVDNDYSKVPTQRGNWVQYFNLPVMCAGQMEHVAFEAMTQDQFTKQSMLRMREMIRNFERAVLRGVSNGNSAGSKTTPRRFDGVFRQLELYAASSISTLAGSEATYSDITNLCAECWDEGNPVDAMVMSLDMKKVIDKFNASATISQQDDRGFQRQVDLFKGTFTPGGAEMIVNRSMPTGSLLMYSKSQIEVVPLEGRSFQFKEVASGGDSKKGHVIGDYSVAVRNPKGMRLVFKGSAVY